MKRVQINNHANPLIMPIMVLAMAFAFSACSGDDGDGGSSNSSSSGGTTGNVSSSSGGTEISSSSTGSQCANNTGTGSVTFGDQEYKYVTICNQTWLAKNLNIETETGVSKCYDDDPGNCAKYGRLYDWEAAKTVCPSGWHLPTKDEWDELAETIEGDQSCTDCAAKHLKAVSGWDGDGNGEDTYGFAALPGGYGLFGNSFSQSGGLYGSWWSASEVDEEDYVYYCGMDYDYERANMYYAEDKTNLYSVRCLQN